jgi:ATP-binding cassette subfamily B protein
LIDGLLDYLTLVGRETDPTLENASLADYQRQGRPLALETYLLNPQGDLYLAAASSFVAFLIAEYGTETFKQFIQQFESAAPDAASQAVYEKPFKVLEKQWLIALAETPLPTLRFSRFVALSLRYVRPYAGWALLLLIPILLKISWDVFSPALFQAAFDSLTAVDSGTDRTRNILLIGVVLASALVARFVGLIGMKFVGGYLGGKVVNDLRVQVFQHLQHLSLDFFSRYQTIDLTARFSVSFDTIEASLAEALPGLVGFAFQFAGSVIFLLALKWELTLVSLVLVSAILYFTPRLLGPAASEAGVAQEEGVNAVNTTVRESITAQRLIKVFWLHDLVRTRLDEQLHELLRTNLRANVLVALVENMTSMGGNLMRVLVLVVGGLLVIDGRFTLGEMVAFDLYLQYMVSAVEDMASYLTMLQDAKEEMQWIEELLAEKTQAIDRPGAYPLRPFSGAIQFRNVTFSYTGNVINMRQLNARIDKGQFIAVVGPSGAGKSTFLNLILRLYHPTIGTVSIDNHDLENITQASLSRQVAIVFQEESLLIASIRENIRAGRLDATDEEVEQAAKVAEIHNEIVNLPDGYDTPVGQYGRKLSGGQSQRLAIARTLLRRPAILLLDEVTSALDPATETAIHSTIKEISKSCTIISVTHRLALAKDADQIFVLEGGHLVEDGTHEQLIRQDGMYQQLWQKQSGFEITPDSQYATVTPARLKGIPLFESLDDAERMAVAQLFTTERYAKDQFVFMEGDPGEKFYVLVWGKVEVLGTAPGGKQRRLGVLLDGDYFGESALLGDSRRGATVHTLLPSIFLVLQREQFIKLLQEMPALRNAIESTRLQHQLTDIVSLGTKKPTASMLDIFLDSTSQTP